MAPEDIREDYWRSLLDRLLQSLTPAGFREYLDRFNDPQRKPSPPLEVFATLQPVIAGLSMAHTMVVAMLQLPTRDAEQAFEHILKSVAAAAVENLDTPQLKGEQREWYFAAMERMLEIIVPAGEGVTAMCRAYLRGDYDLDEDPNELIRRANQMLAQVDESLQSEQLYIRAARALVGRAGALALRGKPLWDRWIQEGLSPLDDWMMLIGDGIQNLRQHPEVFPFGPIEEMRPRWRQTVAGLESAPMRKTGQRELVDPYEGAEELMEHLGPWLLEGEDPSPEELHALPLPADRYLEFLVDLISRWEELLEHQEAGPLLCNVAILVGTWQAEETIEHLLNILDEMAGSDEDELLEGALEGLLRMDEAAREPLRQFCMYSSNDTVRADLGWVLAQIDPESPQTYPLLERLFDEISWEDGKQRIAEALGLLGDGRAVSPLKEELASLDSEDWRAMVLADALEQLTDQGSEQPG